MNKSDYKKYSESKSVNSPLLKDVLKAFCVGGVICVIGQGLIELYGQFGFDKDSSGTLSSITLVFISALMTSMGLYDKVAKFAGAGTLVPITGFANAVVSPAIEFKDEGYVLGVAANMFKIAGPVIVYGVITSVLSGIYFWLFI